MPGLEVEKAPYQAILFDLDGVLLDTLLDIAASGNQVLAVLGLPGHPVSAYRHLVGRGLRRLAEDMLPDESRTLPLAAKAYELLKIEYQKRQFDAVRPYPGIEDLLPRLAAGGLKMTILSNKDEELVRALVGRFWPADLFDLVWGAQPERPLKPHPAGALAQARALSIPAERFMYLGDSGLDMLTARAAGMTAVGANWGFRGRRELEEAGARYLIDRPGQLLELLNLPAA